MIDTGAIRQSIIDNAIEGKLVNKESCSILSGVALKDSDIEKWCGLPENWGWTCLDNLADSNYLNDGNWVLKKDMVPDGPVKLIQLGSVGKCFFKDKDHKRLTLEHFAELNGTQIYPGYLLINRLVTSGLNVCIIPDIEGVLMTAVDVCWVRPNETRYNIKYLMYALSSTGIQAIVNQLGHGVTRFRISKLNLIKIPIPYPPLEVQNMIVDKIDELFALCDTIDELQAAYSSDLEVLKSKITDAGIQGKLTEQLPGDGNAEDLYAVIQEEKEKLIKEKKIKKAKALPEITEEEITFEIPDNWKWVRISEVGITNTGSTPTKSNPANYGGSYPFFKPSDLDAGNHITKASEYLSDIGKLASRQFEKGTILVCCIGSIGKCAVIDVDGTSNQQINALTPIMCDSDYLLYVIQSNCFKNQLFDKSRATTVEIIKKSKFDECIIPFPPLKEQIRIAEVIEKTLSMI